MALINLNQRRWIFIAVFWILLLASIGFAEHYRWIKTAWVGIVWLFAAVGSVYSVIEMFRSGRSDGNYTYYRGVPRCMRWFVLDDEEYAKDLERQRAADKQMSEREPRDERP